VSLLVLSILLKSLTADRNQKNCNGSCPHSRSTAQLVAEFTDKANNQNVHVTVAMGSD